MILNSVKLREFHPCIRRTLQNWKNAIGNVSLQSLLTHETKHWTCVGHPETVPPNPRGSIEPRLKNRWLSIYVFCKRMLLGRLCMRVTCPQTLEYRCCFRTSECIQQVVGSCDFFGNLYSSSSVKNCFLFPLF